MSSTSPDNTGRQARLNEVIASYLEAVEAGRAPDREAWLAKYRDLADDLRRFFANHDRVAQVGEPLRALAPAGPPPGEPPTQAPGAATATPSPGKVRTFGDYELLEEIDRGGMGVVWRARQVSLNREVALKMILAGNLASEDDVQRFHREAEAAAKLDHPCIVPIYEVGEQGGQHYFSMKLVNGASLARRVADFARAPESAARLLAKVARAVHHAHQHGVIHRDLKPGNILLDAQGEPYVGDFGLAKHVDGRSLRTRTGAIVGTPSYMAPEQARSERALTAAVDVYGLGAILYELLTGRPPFRAATELDTILQVLDRDPPRPRAINPRVHPGLETICLKCLEKAPGERYVSALALAEDLERWLAGQAIRARPSRRANGVLQWARRHPYQAAFVVVAACSYFGVPLPWLWRGDLLLGVFILVGLSRIGVVCARATGSLPGYSRTGGLDVVLLAGALLALLTVGLYNGGPADRTSLALSVAFISFFWGWVIQWARRTTQAGPLLLALRASPPWVIIATAVCGVFILGLAYELNDFRERGGDLLVNICSRVGYFSGLVFFVLMLVVGVEIRHQGLVTFHRFIPWEEVESFEWRQSGWSPDRWVLGLELRNNRLPLNKSVPLTNKALVDGILTEHLQRGGEGAATNASPSGTSECRGWEPAERVRTPALCLMISGVVQIVVSGGLLLAMAPLAQIIDLEKPGSGMANVVPLFVLPLSAVGAPSGLIVVAGALRMRKLHNYRLCRVSSILAVLSSGCDFLLGLPLGVWALLVLRRPDVQVVLSSGCGFLLGVPFGVWALLVLRRPDVRAAFAANDDR